MYNNGNSSKNVTGASIVDGTVETVDIADDAVTVDKLANAINTDIATGVSGSTTAGDALPKAGGAMTGAITTNSTFDGRDVATDGAALDVLDLAINSAADAVAITIDVNENVGIGTASPAGLLHSEKLANDTLHILDTYSDNSGHTPTIQYRNSHSDTKAFVATPNGGWLGNTEWHGVGSGNTKFVTGARMLVVQEGSAGADYVPARMEFKTSDGASAMATAMTITGDRDVYFPTEAATGSVRVVYSLTEAELQVKGVGVGPNNRMRFLNGNGVVGSIVTNASATAYNTSSDYRLKENVVPMTGSIDRLKDLKPSRFNFKADTDKTVDGFLAHEAGEVVPECVSGIKDAMRDEEYEVTPAVMDGDTVVTEAVMGTRSVPDYQGIDQSKLVPLLVAALQEAIARIEVLETP
jgi:hypothetical protein